MGGGQNKVLSTLAFAFNSREGLHVKSNFGHGHSDDFDKQVGNDANEQVSGGLGERPKQIGHARLAVILPRDDHGVAVFDASN